MNTGQKHLRPCRVQPPSSSPYARAWLRKQGYEHGQAHDSDVHSVLSCPDDGSSVPHSRCPEIPFVFRPRCVQLCRRSLFAAPHSVFDGPCDPHMGPQVGFILCITSGPNITESTMSPPFDCTVAKLPDANESAPLQSATIKKMANEERTTPVDTALSSADRPDRLLAH